MTIELLMIDDDIYDIPEELTRVHETISEWSLFDPKPHARRINRLLRKPAIRKAYDKAARAAEAVARWDAYRYFEYERLSTPTPLLDGEEFLYPEQIERSDWRWDCPPGRPPLYYSFACSRICHWLASGHRLLASQLFPDLQWDVISSEFHTTAVCLEQKLLFDLTYAAMGVTVESALEMILGEDLQGREFDYWPDDTYDCTTSDCTRQAMDFWKLCDSHTGDKQVLALELKRLVEGDMEPTVSTTATEVAWNCGDLLADDRELELV